MSNTTTLELYCFVKGDDDFFAVRVPLTMSIGDLESEIIKELRVLQSMNIRLWKPTVDILRRPSVTLADRVRGWFQGPDFSQFAELLESDGSVAEYFGPNQAPKPRMIHILVQLRARHFGETTFEAPPSQLNRAEFTIKLRSLACWDRLSEYDLAYSDINHVRSSERLKEVKARLGRKRYIEDDVADVFGAFLKFLGYCSTNPPKPWDSYFETVIPAGTNLSELDFVTINELNHYISVIGGLELRNKAKYNDNKECQVYTLLLEFLGRLQSVPSNSWGFGTSLPFHLVIETDGEKLKHTPRSDFHMQIKDFPHFILKVNSQPSEGDHYRMLLEAACISRIGNWLRALPSGKLIVIMAIHIDEGFNARQHLLYQPDVRSTKVEYVTEIFDLTDPQSAFELIFQLYNFLSEAKSDNDGLNEPRKQLLKAKYSVARKGYTSFSKRKHEEMGDTAPDGDQDCFGDQSVQGELTRAGYTLAPPLPEGFTLLTPLNPTMRRATSRSGVSVVLKTVVDPIEHRLLRYLGNIKAPSNHTIPLLDAIDLSIGKTIIVLPRKSPLDEVLQLGARPDDVMSLCVQFIEGVAFLHEHNVAHCDLKPGNIVVDTKIESETSGRLFIIDFDLAQSVDNEETMTEGWCGTPPWIAPELGSENGPTQRYSPILADRWACGRVIEHFANYIPTYEGERKTKLLAFAQRLLDVDPRARPGLGELQIFHGSTKRKQAKSPTQHEPEPKRHASCG